MRTLILALAVLVGTMFAAQAAPHFTTTGWYEIADTDLGPFIYGGPYADEPSCNLALPRDDSKTKYRCKYLEERPPWDE